jgi:hypothetical protein
MTTHPRDTRVVRVLAFQHLRESPGGHNACRYNYTCRNACGPAICVGTPERVDDPKRPRATNAAVQAEYARLAGISPAALTAAMEPYLPIVYVFALLGPAPSPALRERLIQRVEATLRAEG